METKTPQPLHDKMTKVIGLYGIKGCGKSFLLDKLKNLLDHGKYMFVEGSEELASVVPGGLDAFNDDKDPESRTAARERAIKSIAERCKQDDKIAIVAGHFSLWDSRENKPNPMYTESDLEIYSHILYLDTPEDVTKQRALNDETRPRQDLPSEDLKKWKDFEVIQLRKLCFQWDIHFSLLCSDSPAGHIARIIDGLMQSEQDNLISAQRRLDDIMSTPRYSGVKKMLVFDADRTITPEDTGYSFWYNVSSAPGLTPMPLRKIFGRWKYAFTAFQQAALLYEEVASRQDLDQLCLKVAKAVKLYPQMETLLRLAANSRSVSAVIVTCGLRRIWENVLERYGWKGKIAVIGMDETSNGFVVTPQVKEEIVSRLIDGYDMHVHGFGDSPTDLGMLKRANSAIIIVGDESTRSKTMDGELKPLIDSQGLTAMQAIVSPGASPRLTPQELPQVDLTSYEFLSSIFGCLTAFTLDVFEDTSSSAAKYLATATRDSEVHGPELFDHHKKNGAYLATRYLTDVLELEEYPIPHVQGKTTQGFRLANEKETLVLSIMRGGLPLALGVWNTFPETMLDFPKNGRDLQEATKQVILVDYVVNEGKTMIEFIKRIHCFDASIEIVIVAGVSQADFIARDMESILLPSGRQSCEHVAPCSVCPLTTRVIKVVTLRVSENKYKGKGGTDTGNRLFNTTHLK
ncbi:hypothetical protein KEM56_002451 [Ascosphaera pollenicola]|nr:hypothetical protein KEM56_002451 [Ascosphaera pollenicola]